MTGGMVSATALGAAAAVEHKAIGSEPNSPALQRRSGKSEEYAAEVEELRDQWGQAQVAAQTLAAELRSSQAAAADALSEALASRSVAAELRAELEASGDKMRRLEQRNLELETQALGAQVNLGGGAAAGLAAAELTTLAEELDAARVAGAAERRVRACLEAELQAQAQTLEDAGMQVVAQARGAAVEAASRDEELLAARAEAAGARRMAEQLAEQLATVDGEGAATAAVAAVATSAAAAAATSAASWDETSQLRAALDEVRAALVAERTRRQDGASTRSVASSEAGDEAPAVAASATSAVRLVLPPYAVVAATVCTPV